MTDIFITLLNMSITAGWLIFAVILLRVLLKNAPKKIRCILWTLVGIRLVCPFTLESVFSLIPSKEVVSPSIIYSQSPSINSGIPAVNNAVNNAMAQMLTPAAGDSVNPMQIVAFVASIIWATGVAAMLIYALISFLKLKKRVGASVALRDNIRLCDSVESPFILGIIKPEIYLPSDMDEAQMTSVIAHEAAHLKRYDHWWKPLGFALLAVYWFNPLCWAAYILLCRDIELACDERVIKDMDIQSKKDYSSALLACSVSRRGIAACPLAFGEVGVKERVKSVLNYKKPAFWIIAVSLIACFATTICLATSPIGKYSLSGEYAVSQNIYCDGIYSYYMTPETAPVIEINNSMQVSELKDGETLSSGLFKKTKLSQENFGSLLNGYEIWQNDESAENIQKQNKAAWWCSLQTEENGILPYMILQQKDDSVYIVYVNVQDGKASSIRWIFTLEKQNYTSVEIDDALTVFLDTTIVNQNSDNTTADVFVTIDYKILGTEKSGSETTVYLWVLYQEYAFDGELKLASGSHLPTAITVNKKGDTDGDSYELIEYWIPRDGSYYADDIKNKFPSTLWNKALDSQWCIDEQEASCLESAQQYYNLTTIDGSVDVPVTTVTQSPEEKEGKNPYFNATVLEIYDGSVLVEPFDGTDERKSSDQISVSLAVVSTNPVPKLQKGDKIRVVYNGMIAETYPAQINTVFAVYALDENGEVIFIQSEPVTDAASGESNITVKANAGNKAVRMTDDAFNKKYGFNVYGYGVESVSIKVGSKYIDASTALNSEQITPEQLVKLAIADAKKTEAYKDGGSEIFISYDDGGSTVYPAGSYALLKLNRLEGSKDIYIGTPDLDINEIV